jgi:electron transfer flavoprotein alpha subunit
MQSYVISENNSFLAELCAGAKKVADNVTAIVFGDASSVVCGADHILTCPLEETGSPEDYAKAIAEEIKKVDSACVLVGNTIIGRALAGMLGVYLDTAVFTNIAQLSLEGDKPCFDRTVFGGTANKKQTVETPYSVFTVNSGIFDAEEAIGTCGDVAQISGSPSTSLKRISKDEKRETAVNLVAAKRIVDVGRGLAAEEDLEMCRKLASVINAEVGCSRPIAENNKWMPKACYMGITGVQVKPDLIICAGVSGQVQHIGGINKSKTIVAINKDKSAPIFKNCDFGLVGDMYKIIPLLTDKLS